MKLEPYQRLLLMNQYRLLSLTDSGEAEFYSKCVSILENGFELEYHRFEQTIYSTTMSEGQCIELIEILEMFTAVERAYSALAEADKVDIDAWKAKYEGFDGNNPVEGLYMSYARFLIEKDGRWPNLKGAHGHNSHHPSLDGYRAMLREWTVIPLEGKHRLSPEQLARIVSARHV